MTIWMPKLDTKCVALDGNNNINMVKIMWLLFKKNTFIIYIFILRSFMVFKSILAILKTFPETQDVFFLSPLFF